MNAGISQTIYEPVSTINADGSIINIKNVVCIWLPNLFTSNISK
jgi:hypothetical protein